MVLRSALPQPACKPPLGASQARVAQVGHGRLRPQEPARRDIRSGSSDRSKATRPAISTVRARAWGKRANRRAISAGGLRWRSALAARRSPGDGAVLPDAGQHVLQGLLAVVEHVVHRHHRGRAGLGQPRQPGDAPEVAGAVAAAAASQRSPRRGIRSGRGAWLRSRRPAAGAAGPGPAVPRRGLESRPGSAALALFRAALADRQQAGQPPISLAVRGITDQVGARRRRTGGSPSVYGCFALVRRSRPAPPRPWSCGRRPRWPPGPGPRHHQLGRMRRALQEREVRGGLEFGADHGRLNRTGRAATIGPGFRRHRGPIGRSRSGRRTGPPPGNSRAPDRCGRPRSGRATIPGRSARDLGVAHPMQAGPATGTVAADRRASGP